MRRLSALALALAVVALALVAGMAVAATTATAVVCTSVENRAPVGAADQFPATVGKLACFSEVKGGSGKVVHVWLHGDKQLASIELQVKGERWRTWSEKRIPADATGKWKVEVRAEDGTVLASKEFTVQ